ncbi:MAG: UDP-N-acetylglucosamine 4,6-dehydratase (inverting) [bacterium]
MSFKNKTILVTGGTGSFGNKFIEILLKEYNPASIRVFSRDELKQFQMQQKFGDNRIRYFLGDVRDKDRIYRATKGVDIVVHAAALKQVPACEYNPFEAIKTNILGTQNVIDASIDNNVEKVMCLITDKAVNPVNLYGATKLCAEKLAIQSNAYVGKGKTKISALRYGNVMGSRGSVIPLFLEQRKNEGVTITDKRMTRFWITQEQAVNFIIDCISKMHGGEVFIPKIPSMKIVDLVKVIAPKAKVEVIGIRPGEKLHEMLLHTEEARHSKEYGKYYVIEPQHSFWGKRNYKDGKKLPEGFAYTSDTNKKWMDSKQIKESLKTLSIEL